MTTHEAVRYLRLDEPGRDIADAVRSLERLVRRRLIRPCRIGRHRRYAKAELDRFVVQQTERYLLKDASR